MNKIKNSFSDVVFIINIIIFSLFIVLSVITYFHDDLSFFIADKILNIFYPNFYRTMERKYVVIYGQLISLICFSLLPHIAVLIKRKDRAYKNILSDNQEKFLLWFYILGVIMIDALCIYLISKKIEIMPSPTNKQNPPLLGFIFIPSGLLDWLDKLSLYYCMYFAPLFIKLTLLRISYIGFSWGRNFYSVINFIFTIIVLSLSTITHFLLSSVIGIAILFGFICGSFFLGGGVLNSLDVEPNSYILDDGTSVNYYSGSTYIDSFGNSYTKNGSYFEKK